jgi:peptidoglycan/LPS O-acetylase OafA/YrhL
MIIFACKFDNMNQHTYLASKPRYEVLDGLRGVASLMVVAFHLFETYSQGPQHQIINHGYLAVDFFFVLSGFVVGYAYDDRWGRMSLRDFFKRRLVRLHPMVIMGTLIGALLFYLGDCDMFSLVGQTPWWMLILMTLWGCMLLPSPNSWDIRGWQETSSLNGPTWSLFFEYIANILYALVIRHFPRWLLALFVIGAGMLTLDLTLNIDFFGLLEGRGGTAYTAIGGWSFTPQQLYVGFSRLLYPFFMGLLLSRFNKLIRTGRTGFLWCSVLVVLMLAMPRLGGSEQMWLNGAYEAFCIIVMFPLVVLMGAGSTLRGKQSAAVCTFLGEISYPLYITHYPLIYLHIAWAEKHPDAPLGTVICLSVSLFIFAIGIAYASLKLYDLPVREWLKRHWLMK